jgi:hypothetical protein
VLRTLPLGDDDQSERTVHFYCSYCDHRYLPRALALYESMRRHCGPFRFWLLCLSDECYEAARALALPKLEPVRLQTLEADDDALASAKRERSTVEYYFTLTPSFMAWVLRANPQIDVLTYLDADVYFFNSPRFVLEEFADHSTLIVPHRFSPRNFERRKWGLYNVGWISFRRDVDGLACLEWWRRSCLEWCRDIVEENRYADQKYLDRFPERFQRVQIASHPGVNLAPWNLDNYAISSEPGEAPRVDGKPVIFFHFHRLRRIAPFLWHTRHRQYNAPLNRAIRTALYAPYLEAIARAERRLTGLMPGAAPLRRRATEPWRRRPLKEIIGTALALSRGWIWHIPVTERSAAKAPLRLAALTALESWRAIKTRRASRPRRGWLG